MKSNYNVILDRVLKSEGGYTNDPRDPGGATNFGITIKDYRRYINSKGTPEDVKNMKVDEAKAIYKKAYWDALKCDDLPSGVDYTVFDYGVNSGIGRAQKIYEKLAPGKTPVDLINAINDERTAFLQGLKTFATFGKGWMTRVAIVRKYSLQLAAPKVTPQPIPQPEVKHEWSIFSALALMGASAAAFTQQHPAAVIIGGTALLLGVWFVYKNRK